MPNNTQTILPTLSSLTMPPSHSYTVMQFRSTPNDDEDHICPVCESECTCPSTTDTFQPPPPPPVLPLKIKLPPLNPIPKSLPPKRPRPKSTKQKQTTAGSVTVDGTNNSITPGHQLAHPLPPNALRDSSPLTPEPDQDPPPKSHLNPKRPTKTPAPKTRKRLLTTPPKPKQTPRSLRKKTGSATPANKKKVDKTWTSRRKRTLNQHSSDGSDPEPSEHDRSLLKRIRLDSDDESVQFPTFISAISTTSGNDNDSASITSDSFDSDSSIRAEEENMILVEERAKLRREIFNNEDSWHMEKRKWDHLKNSNNWEIRPRKRSVGAGETETEPETDSDSVVQEEEDEEEGEDDDDPDIRYGRGMVTWQSDDDDFDAELFFATLADSSAPGSDADAEDGGVSGDDQSDANSDLSTISIREAAAAGLLSSPLGANCPLVVTEDWDGRLVFANGLKDGQGVLDVHFEVNATQRCCSLREAEDPLDETEDVPEGEDDDDVISDDDGETTDDMLDHPGISTPQGVVPLPFRCPTPPVTSIDPLSTLSPISGSRRGKLPKCTVPPNPADILAGVKKILWESVADKDSNNSGISASASVASPPETAASTQCRPAPSMGNFKRVSGDPKQCAVIDGSKAVVYSPFSRHKRVRKQVERGRKRVAAGNDIFPYTSKRSRQSSLPDSNRALLSVDADESASPLIQSSPELPLPAEPIDLDDVLDAAFLDSDDTGDAAANTSGERHLRNLTRWDRVPMGTFRRSRTAHMDENSVCISTLARPNDGVSYGSAGGHVLRKSPLGAALWQTNSTKTSRQPPGTVPVSPVIFPQRDGEHTPTGHQSPDLLQKPLPGDAGPSKSRKQKRKEKKKKKNAHAHEHVSSRDVTSPEFYHVAAANIPLLNL